MEFKKIYTQRLPKTRFIGKKYGDGDRVNGSFGAKWGEAFGTGLFDTIENAAGKDEFFEDSGSYIGLMRGCEGEPFEYWIGMFTKPDTAVPDGFDYVDFPEGEVGIGWIYGFESEVYGFEGKLSETLAEEGHPYKVFEDGACWFFERYQCPRFTTPDADGKIILDLGTYIEK